MEKKVIDSVAKALNEIRNPQTITEEEEYTSEQVEEHAKGIANKIFDIWKEVLPQAGWKAGGSSYRGKPQTTFIRFFVGKEKSEFPAGDHLYDPLNISMQITTHPKDEKISISYDKYSIRTNDTDLRIKFRKQTLKNEKALLARVKKDLTKVKEELVKLYKDNKIFRQDEIEDMLKKKLG